MTLYKIEDIEHYLNKWQKILKLQDWYIKIELINQDWRKSGDIKIDMTDHKAILMINNFNPKITTLEPLLLHELLHLKLWGMDQMIEDFMKMVFGEDESDPKYQFAFTKFMEILEPTVEDLAQSFIALGGEDMTIDFGRLQSEVDQEVGRI